MLSDALIYALLSYILAFALALLTAGIIKVIQMGTTMGGGANKAADKPQEK